MNCFTQNCNILHTVWLLRVHTILILGHILLLVFLKICIYHIFYFRAAKEQKKAAKATKKAVVPAKAKVQPKHKAAKITQKAAPRVGGKR